MSDVNTLWAGDIGDEVVLLSDHLKAIAELKAENERLRGERDEQKQLRKEWRKDYYVMKKDFEKYRGKMHRLHPNHICDYESWDGRP